MAGKSLLIKLNVGGCDYLTTKATLCADPDSLLAKMCENIPSANKDKEGRPTLTIDRDGEMFGYVLNFLRDQNSSKLALPKEFKKIDQLTLEAEFYQIRPLVEEIKRIKSKPAVKRIYYDEDILDYDEDGYRMVYNITGLKEVISECIVPEQAVDVCLYNSNFNFDLDVMVGIKGAYRTKRLSIRIEKEKMKKKSKHLTVYRTNSEDIMLRRHIQDQMLINGWEIETSEKREKFNPHHHVNFPILPGPLLSVTYVKPADTYQRCEDQEMLQNLTINESWRDGVNPADIFYPVN